MKNQNCEKFLKIMEKIQFLASEAEKIGWNEIRKFENLTCDEARIGWAMRDIANHINWWFDNSTDFTMEWEIIEKAEKGE